MSQDVKPTRSEELKLKEKIELADNGHQILEKKRDGLIHEFMEIVDEARDSQEELAEAYSRARLKLLFAKVYDGEDTVRANALSSKTDVKVSKDTQNIMGVLVPDIESDTEIGSSIMERDYGLGSSSSRIDSAVDRYEELVEKIIQVAETQTKLIKLLEEIEKTKRRVNALEHKVIPEMEDSLSRISQVLEESEREETFRMKKIKEMQE